MNFKISLVSTLIAVCLIKVEQCADLPPSSDTCGARFMRLVKCTGPRVKDSPDDDEESHLGHPLFLKPKRTDFTDKIKVAKDKNELEAILANSGDKLVVMAIIDETRKPDVVDTIDILGEAQKGEIAIIVLYLDKCKDAAESYGGNAENPTYVFRRPDNGNVICRYTRTESYKRDFILINHRVNEIRGKTHVRVAFGDDDLDEKFKSAAANESIKLTIIWFETDEYYSVEHGHDHSLLLVEHIAKHHGDVLFIRANINTCPKTFEHWKTVYDKLETTSFVICKSNEALNFLNGFDTQDYIRKIIERPDPFAIVDVKQRKENGSYDYVKRLHYLADPEEQEIPYKAEISANIVNENAQGNNNNKKRESMRTVKEDYTKITLDPKKKKKRRPIFARFIASITPDSW